MLLAGHRRHVRRLGGLLGLGDVDGGLGRGGVALPPDLVHVLLQPVEALVGGALASEVAHGARYEGGTGAGETESESGETSLDCFIHVFTSISIIPK